MISQERIAGYLDRLASGQPTPGGGATAAVQLAQAAALLSMAANFSSGGSEPAERFGSAVRQLIPQALAVADADEHAFGEAASAYELPADTAEDKAHRSNEVQSGLRKAAAPPLRLVELAAELLDLARGLEPEANPNVLSDIAAAAESIRSAAGTAAATLETNAAHLADDAAVQGLQDAAATADDVAAASGALADLLRRRIRGDNS
ncbi:methenyltetrahydrofolate cyclohydrolase or formimidoyltetrahydrofolate cyclodeaminase [Arthrobacter crystallopoietes BAB-32]|uniref:Methenyltetrahydrofolate cyclohydrolase or formimidoyltetrahydrofolate cyclodeaminase n=1 Tax=Arthrobacter crystallopoietes BAB-32 TaxID=1246476 RepID=N1V8Q4_9MICC|nr:cyclodeaminase/cyclohydrolase family protein [Arthrobacter crystallopoietes]EMY34633.1 methenyltetrahydrofolate cyclohydrolase or formimidoyltetrahydrofolate cyclodeaminase [Arthrobacter crystallopoietes BAB-32]